MANKKKLKEKVLEDLQKSGVPVAEGVDEPLNAIVGNRLKKLQLYYPNVTKSKNRRNN